MRLICPILYNFNPAERFIKSMMKDAPLAEDSFLAYRMPGENEWKAYRGRCSEASTEALDSSGIDFVFAPFNASAHALLAFQVEAEIRTMNDVDFQLPRCESKADGMEEYLKKGRQVLDLIHGSEIDKLVLSQPFYQSYPRPNPWALFLVLSQMYQDAFVYLFYIPNHMCWMGATPELLVDVTMDRCRTVALAGTQPLPANGAKTVWGEKEIKEHRFIEAYVEDELDRLKIDYNYSGTRTVAAGQMCHIFSAYDFDLSVALSGLVTSLHPGPAISGYPKDKSIQAINDIESYDRSYYTGYLGIFDHQDVKTRLFINLRCMQLFEDSCVIYAGGGYTDQSDPAKEWEEIKLKSSTMRKLISQVQNKLNAAL